MALISQSWHELAIPSPERAKQLVDQFYVEWQQKLADLRQSGGNLNAVRGLIYPQVQRGYTKAVYLWWLAHHWKQGTLHDTFALPFHSRLVGKDSRPRLCLALYDERCPEAHGVDWCETTAVFITDQPEQIEPALTAVGDKVWAMVSVRLLLEPSFRLLYSSDDGTEKDLPGKANFVDRRPQQGSQTMTHLHPVPSHYDLCHEAGLPSRLAVGQPV